MNVAPFGTFVHAGFAKGKHQPYAGQTEIPDLDNAVVTIETTVQNMGTAPGNLYAKAYPQRRFQAT